VNPGAVRNKAGDALASPVLREAAMDMFAADPLVEEKRVEEERFASAYLPGEIAEPFPQEAFAAEILPEEEPPAPPVSLPGAVPVPPAGGAAAVRRLAIHLASVVPRSWNRRHMLLAGAAVIALGAAGIGFCMWPGTPVATAPQQAGAAGVGPMPLAPSATLARVPTTPAEPSTRQKYAPQRQDQQLQQLLALRGGDAASAASAPDREGPSGRDQPPSGYVASEPGANRESSSAAPLAVAAASPAAMGMPASARESSPPPAATPTVIPDPAAGLSPAPPKPPAPPRADMPADPVKTASLLQPGPMTTADQVQVLEVVTQMAAMVRDLRAEQVQQRTDFAKAEGDMAARLTDFERRLALAEAGRAMAVAREAGAPPAAPATLAATVAATAPASPASSPGQNAAGAGSTPPVQVTPAAAAAPAADKGAAKRYRVQAASPGLALLAEIDRGGGDGAQIQILVGDTIPGYGKVAAIGQRGTAWVVTTEHGDIQ
jgi:hypothetical protein